MAEPVASGLRRDGGVVYAALRGTATVLPTALAWPAGALPAPAARVRDVAAGLARP